MRLQLIKLCTLLLTIVTNPLMAQNNSIGIGMSLGVPNFADPAFASNGGLTYQHRNWTFTGYHSFATSSRVVNPISSFEDRSGTLFLMDVLELDAVSNFFHRRETNTTHMFGLCAGYSIRLGARLSLLPQLGWSWTRTSNTIFSLNSNEGLGRPFYAWYDTPRSPDGLRFDVKLFYDISDTWSAGAHYASGPAFG